MIKWYRNAVTDVVTGPRVDHEMLDLGWRIAREAAAHAPIQEQGSQGGAASIQAQLFRSFGHSEVRVSWDRAHFYMQFHEFGTEKLPAQAFLRNAARRYQ